MKHAADILLGIRFKLDLYINLRPIKLYDERLCPLKGKGDSRRRLRGLPREHRGRLRRRRRQLQERHAGRDRVQEEIHTRKGVERIIRAAFEYAVQHGRREVCMADKSNVMRYSRRPLAARLRRGGGGVPADRAPPPLRRRPDHADGAAAGELRRHRHQQHVRRHRHRPRRRAAGRPRRRRLGQPPPRRGLDVRAGARLGAEVRRHRPRQPGGGDPLAGVDARLPRPRRGGGGGGGARWRRASATARRRPTSAARSPPRRWATSSRAPWRRQLPRIPELAARGSA